MNLGFLVKSNLKKRIAASVMDIGIMINLCLICLFFSLKTNSEGYLEIDKWVGIPWFSLWVFYFVIVEGLFGATLGHQILGLKVMTLEGGKINFLQSLKRHSLDFIDYNLLGVPSIICITGTLYHQRIGDLWAGTLVIDQWDREQSYPPPGNENTC